MACHERTTICQRKLAYSAGVHAKRSADVIEKSHEREGACARTCYMNRGGNNNININMNRGNNLANRLRLLSPTEEKTNEKERKRL